MSKHMLSLQQSLLEKTSQLKIKRSQILIVFNLQNEFASLEGKLPCNDFTFVNRIKELVPKFREKAGDIIWIRSEFETDRCVNDGSAGSDQVVLAQYNPENVPSPVTDKSPVLSPVSTAESSSGKKGLKKKKSRHLSNILNYKTKKKEEKIPQKESVNPTPIPKSARPLPGTEELFLASNHGYEQRCSPDTTGADFVPEIKDSVQSIDETIVASHYSAVKGTDLINTLHSKLASEVYMCGCISNLSIYATVADMIGHGFKLQVIEDCLGFRTLQDHEEAMKILLDDEKMGIGSITSTVIHEDLDAPLETKDSRTANVTDIAESMGAMTIASEKGKEKAAVKDASQTLNPPSALKENKVRVRSRARQRPPANVQFPKKPMLPADEQAQVFAALEKLSVKDEDESPLQPKPRSESKSKRSKPMKTSSEGSSDFQEAPVLIQPASIDPASTQPASDSSVPQEVLDAIKQNKTLVELHSGKKIQAQEKGFSTESSEEARSVMEARKAVTESLRPLHTPTNPTPAGPKISATDANRSSTSPGKKLKIMPLDHAPAMKLKNLSNLPTLGPGDKIGEGDSSIRYELLPSTHRDELDDRLPLSDTIFTALYHEVQWQKMYHAAGEVPRLVAVQGAISANGDKPLYRHPSDQAPLLLPFTKNVNIIRREAEKIIGHELNHVLIQLYRDGKDFISEHSDKTLDIMPRSKIVNASFGAQRTMRLRTKKSGFETEESIRQTQRIPMPHNSLFALGLVSNKLWLHGINPDKRLPAEKTPAELAYNGRRISLTFRYIGTFLDKEEQLIWGQGAVGRSKDEARSVINGNEAETDKMIQAFSKENREGAGFVWREAYGSGFDVLHFRDAADELQEAVAQK